METKRKSLNELSCKFDFEKEIYAQIISKWFRAHFSSATEVTKPTAKLQIHLNRIRYLRQVTCQWLFLEAIWNAGSVSKICIQNWILKSL